MAQHKGWSLGEVIDEITQLEHFHSFNCSNCGEPVHYHVLQIDVLCQNCNTKHKVRGYGSIGTEVHDVIDAVLKWAGEGARLEAVMSRQREIQKHQDGN